MKQTIQSLKGTRDFYPHEMAVRNWLYENIREVSESANSLQVDRRTRKALLSDCLSPRIITHGQNLRDDFRVENGVPLYKRIEEAGLELWRVSIHGGTAESHDKVLGSVGSFDKLVANLDNLSKPVQFNTTLLDSNYKDLPVNIIKERPPTVYNIIYFLPYFFWSTQTGPTEADFQVQYVESAPYVAEAINTLEALGWEVNVRYWPLCIAKQYGFEANVSGYHLVPFDPWEWRLNATARVSMDAIEKQGGWYEAERQLALKSMSSGRPRQRSR